MSKLKTLNKIGATNESGSIIIPVEYDDINILKGYYYLCDNTLTLSDTEIYAAVQYYKDLKLYTLYTEKGPLFFASSITAYYCDYSGKLVALKTGDNFYHFVIVDTKSNSIKSLLHSNEITKIYNVNHNHIVYTKNSKLYIYSLEKQTNILGPLDCEKAIIQPKGIFIKSNGKKGLYDYTGKEILKCEWDELKLFSNDYIITKKNSKYGLCLFNGKHILSCQYTNLIPHSIEIEKQIHTYFHVTYTGNKDTKETIFIIDDQLKPKSLITSYQILIFDWVKTILVSTATGYALYKIQAINNRILISKLISADIIQPFAHGNYYKIYQNNKCGVCDSNGIIRVPIKYKTIQPSRISSKVYAYKAWLPIQEVYQI